MKKHKFLLSTLLSIAGTSAFVITKKRKAAKQENVRKNLRKAVSKEFNSQNINGYWIDFDNQKGLEYVCGINIENKKNGLIDSYSFLFNPESNEIYRVKLISDTYK